MLRVSISQNPLDLRDPLTIILIYNHYQGNTQALEVLPKERVIHSCRVSMTVSDVLTEHSF